jgi:signal peptidase II
MRSVPAGRYLLFAAVAAAGSLADLATKSWVFARVPLGGEVWWLWEDYLGFQTSLNKGALFGMGQGLTWLFAGLSVVALVFILYWLFVARAAIDRLLTLALAMVTGGILGNLYDRLAIGGVRDWILMGLPDWKWPNYNIADSLLVLGAALLLWHARGDSQHPAEPSEFVREEA